MTDKTPEQHLEEQRQKALTAINDLYMRIDTRMLFAVLLGKASAIGERLIAAGMLTNPEVLNMFASACADATTPSEAPAPQVLYMDGGEALGSKH